MQAQADHMKDSMVAKLVDDRHAEWVEMVSGATQLLYPPSRSEMTAEAEHLLVISTWFLVALCRNALPYSTMKKGRGL